MCLALKYPITYQYTNYVDGARKGNRLGKRHVKHSRRNYAMQKPALGTQIATVYDVAICMQTHESIKDAEQEENLS